MPESRHEEFVRLLLLHQKELFRYIVAFVPNLPDAQEVMQETAIALWRKFDQYDNHSPFGPWAKQFAHFEMLKFYRSRSKYMAFLSTDLIDQLAAERDRMEPALEERHAALRVCMEKLPADDRQLIEVRYGADQTLIQFADESQQSIHMIRKRLVRIRRKLLDCISRRLAGGVA